MSWLLFLISFFINAKAMALNLNDSVKTETNKIKIAILDSGFCPDLLNIPKKVKIKPLFFATPHSFNLDCKNENLNQPRFHGHKVLTVILNEIQKHLSEDPERNLQQLNVIEIEPIVMLDEKGIQSEMEWLKAFQKIQIEKYNFVLTSIGLAFENRNALKKSKLGFKNILPIGPNYFFASGEKVGRLAHSEIFPQILVTENSLHAKINLIGVQYFDGKKWVHNNETFYSTFVNDWINEDRSTKYKGSSFAAPIALVQKLFSN